MKVTISLLTAATVFSGLSSAQGALPSCAQGCVTKFTSGTSIGGCSNINVVCICSSSDFLSGIACCLADVCSPTDQQAAVQYAQSFCKLAGVTNLPAAVSCASTAATGSATTAPSSTGTGSSAAVMTSASSSSAQSSAMSSASTASSAASTSASHSSSGSQTTASGTSAASSASSAAASTSKNASPHNVAGVGAGFLGGVVAVVALL